MECLKSIFIKTNIIFLIEKIPKTKYIFLENKKNTKTKYILKKTET